MSNGGACCASEVCCDPPGARVKAKAALVAMGMDPAQCDILWAWMDYESLMFADTSLRPFVQKIATMARAGK